MARSQEARTIDLLAHRALVRKNMGRDGKAMMLEDGSLRPHSIVMNTSNIHVKVAIADPKSHTVRISDIDLVTGMSNYHLEKTFFNMALFDEVET